MERNIESRLERLERTLRLQRVAFTISIVALAAISVGSFFRPGTLEQQSRGQATPATSEYKPPYFVGGDGGWVRKLRIDDLQVEDLRLVQTGGELMARIQTTMSGPRFTIWRDGKASLQVICNDDPDKKGSEYAGTFIHLDGKQIYP